MVGTHNVCRRGPLLARVETPNVVTTLRDIRVGTELDSIVKRETIGPHARRVAVAQGSKVRPVDTKLPHFQTGQSQFTRIAAAVSL